MHCKNFFSSLVLASTLLALPSASFASPNGFCTGDQVITDYGDVATVDGVLENGEVMIYVDGDLNSQQWPTYRLAKTSGCASGHRYCVGNIVVTDYGVTARIGGVLQNGDVMIHADGDIRYHEWPVDRLALTRACTTSQCE